MSTYIQLSEDTIINYIESVPELVKVLSPETSTWTISEIGDGNVNYIYLVSSPAGAFVLKQAVPFIRIAPNWALTSDRIYYEAEWFRVIGQNAPEYLPEILHFDREMSVLVESYLTPDVILRNGMMEGIKYEMFAEQIATFLASSLFYTSDLFLKGEEKKRLVEKFAGNVLIHITEDVIFTEPFGDYENNHHNPLIDDIAQEIKSDIPLKLKVSVLKNRFMNATEALLHADLHTGSIMLTQEKTHIIDSEFTSYGPMGFDIGLLIGNMLLSFFSQEGHEGSDPTYKTWILQTITDIWNLFTSKFTDLWNEHHSGDLYNFFGDNEEAKKAAQSQYLSLILQDTIGYATIAMIRRTLGIAHVADIDSIENETVRATVERKVLEFARVHLLKYDSYISIEDFLSALY